MNVCVVNLDIVLVTSPEAITPAVFYSWWRLNSGLARAGSGWRRSTLTIYHTLRQDTSPSGSKPPRRHTSPLAVCCRNLLTEVKLDASPSLLTDKDPDLLQSPLSSPVRRRPTHTASFNWTGEGNEDRRSLISSSVAFLSLSLSRLSDNEALRFLSDCTGTRRWSITLDVSGPSSTFTSL